ncbi:hypothetical protein [Peribacillus kribbensis]|nr:hypothetical protein [Peribacillus kribbensis]
MSRKLRRKQAEAAAGGRMLNMMVTVLLNVCFFSFLACVIMFFLQL